jgi:hypothetical protein
VVIFVKNLSIVTIRKTFWLQLVTVLALSVVFSLLSVASVFASAEDKQKPVAVLSGSISAPNDSDAQQLTITASHVKPAWSGSVLVALTAHSDDTLDPGKIAVCKQSDSKCHMLASHNNLGDTNDSYGVASLKIDKAYDVKLHAEAETQGSYTLTLTLAGDTNNDSTITASDIVTISKAMGTRLGDSQYIPAADVDGNGRISAADLVLATKNFGAKVLKTQEPEPTNPLDTPLPDDALSVSGVTLDGFNSTESDVTFNIKSTTFSTDAQDTKITVNDQEVSTANINISDTSIVVHSALKNGKNVIKLSGRDKEGRNLYHQVTVWAGTHSLTVQLVNKDGDTFTQPTEVTVSLPEDDAIQVSGSTDSGTVTFEHVPDRTVLVAASADNNISGASGGTGNEGTLSVTMTGLGEPSEVENNDFSLGTDGWNIGSEPVSIVDHTEEAGPAATGAVSSQHATANATNERKAENSEKAQQQMTSNSIDTTAANKDLVLGTSGEGLRSISRTFATDPGVTAVKMRYRFVTSEVPGGYFGSKYNDYFNVALRSQSSGNTAEADSMNGLGLGAFDAAGSTSWRNITLPVDKAGDVIAVNLGVANVADGLYNSQVVVDHVEDVKARVIPSLSWNNTTGGFDLRYKVEGELEEAQDISVHFATGATYASRTGNAIFTQSVPANTAEGDYGPFHIGGDLLAADPNGTTHFIASSNPTDFVALADVQINFGANADPAAVSAAMTDLVKDALRASGQASATISSTARGPEDQARAMFQNLTRAGRTIQQNINAQLVIYAAAGDAVINTFANAVQGMTREQIIAQSAQIQAAMVAEINNQGCGNVTRHCADPTTLSVVDVGASVFNNSNAPLFISAVQARATRLIDERSTNSCFHIELTI